MTVTPKRIYKLSLEKLDTASGSFTASISGSPQGTSLSDFQVIGSFEYDLCREGHFVASDLGDLSLLGRSGEYSKVLPDERFDLADLRKQFEQRLNEELDKHEFILAALEEQRQEH